MGEDAHPVAPARAASPARRRRARLALGLLALPCLALGILGSLAGSQRALDWAIGEGVAAAASAGVALEVDAVSGSLLGTVRADRLVASRDGLVVEARGIEVDLALLRLALQAMRTRVVALDRLSVAELRIATEPSGEPFALPASLALPVSVSLARVEVGRLQWSGGATPVEIGDLRLGYAGDGERHRLDALSLRWRPVDGGDALEVAGDGSLGAVAPFPLAFTVRAGWGAAAPGARGDLLAPAMARPAAPALARRRPAEGAKGTPALAGAARAVLGGSLVEPRLQAEAEVARGAARGQGRLEAVLQPFADAGPRLEGARLAVSGMDPAMAWPGAPTARLALEAEAAGAVDRLAGHLRVTNALPGPLDVGRVPIAAVDSAWAWEGAASRLRLDALRVQLREGAGLSGRLALEWPRGGPPRVAGAIDARDIDLRALQGGWPATRLSGRLGLAADAAVQRAQFALAQGDLGLEARLEHDGAVLRIPAFRLQVPGRGGPGEALGRAEVGLRAERRFAAEVTLRGFDPFALQARLPAVAGEHPPVGMSAPHGSPARAGPARTGAARPPAPGTSGQGVALQAGGPSAGADMPGPTAGAGAPGLAAVLNGRATARGHLQPAWQVEVDAALSPSEVRLDGRALPLRGEGRGRLDGKRLDALDLRLESGRNRLRAAGTYGQPGDGLDFALEVADLAALLARSSGRLGVKARLDGTPERPALDFRMDGEALAARGVSIGALEASGTLGATPPGATSPLPGALGRLGPARVEAQARRLALPGQAPFDLALRFAGDPARHQLEVEGKAPGAEARATLVGAVEAGPRWQGELRQLDARSRLPVRLLAPVALSVAAGDWRVGPARLTVAGGRISVDALEWRAGRLTTRGSLAALPLGPIHDLLAGRSAERPGPPPILSTLEIGGEWALAATPELNGTLSLRRERGDLSLAGARPFPLGLSRSDLDLRFEAGRLRGRARVDGAAVGEAIASVALDPAPRLDADATLALRVDASVRSLRPFARLLPAVAEIDGAFALRLEASGTPRQPVLSGTLTGQRLRVDAPQVGVALRDGRVEAALASGVLTVTTLEARGGEGRFSASGSIPLRPGGSASSLRWQADRLALLTRPDRRVVLDGQGALGFERGQYRLGGQLRAREGYIEFGRGNRASLGEDVVVRGHAAPAAPTPAPAQGERALALQLEFDFGDAFRLIGSGLDTLVRGRVALATTDGGQLTTRGTVSTDRGTFTAFGQRLEIDRGTIVFNGPVDNPGLDIVALRRLPSVQAGVELTGTARAPRVRITSNPPLSQGEQLSWLVLGRALDSASQADAAMLAGAAAAMFGGDGGVPVNRRIADAFGLDDVGVRSSGVLSGQVVTVGKRVSDRVYFAYEQAVSTASNLLRIDFELHRFVSLRAEAGSVSGFGLVFTRNLR